MKTIVIFGANGRTGKEVCFLAKKSGLKVREFNKKNPSIDELHKIITGVDGVVIVFGPKPPYTDIFCADMTSKVVNAMKTKNIKRLICQTGAMIGNYSHNRSIFFEFFSERYRKSNPLGYKDRVQQEEAIIKSPLKWTIIKPPRLTEGPENKSLQVGENIKMGLLSSVSRKSLALFIVNELLNPRSIRKVVFIKNNQR